LVLRVATDLELPADNWMYESATSNGVEQSAPLNWLRLHLAKDL